jgi:hypothetical protein
MSFVVVNGETESRSNDLSIGIEEMRSGEI